MSIVEYRKVRCDNCGKEEIVKGAGQYPIKWLTLSINEWVGTAGHIRFNAECCSDKCALKFMKKIKKIPKRIFRI